MRDMVSVLVAALRGAVPLQRPGVLLGVELEHVGADRSFECRVVDTRMVNRHNLFVLEVVEAWIDPKQVDPKTIHHRGYDAFSVDGEVIHFKSGMP